MSARHGLVHTGETNRYNLRPVVTYVVLLAAAAATLGLFVLPAGDQLETAPTVAPIGSVTGEAAACLGQRLATVQSGTFLDLQVPGAETAPAVDQLGTRVGRGRIARGSGQAVLDGTCAPGSALSGRPFTARLTFTEDGVDGPSATGTVLVGTDSLDASFVPADARSAPSGGEALAGGELMARIFLAVAVVILAARAVGLAFNRIRQPRVVGEIVAGILLGPSLVGAVWPGFTDYLFPAEVTSVLRVMAQFGLIFFMFLIGLELDVRLVKRSGHAAVLISHASIVVPFTLGAVISLVLYPLLGGGDFTGFTLFMGAAMAITAFPVLARILTETGLHRTRLGALAITCAAVDDVTAWCILAVVVAIVKSTGPLDAAETVALSLAFVVAMLFLVRPLVSRLAAVHEARGRLNPPLMAAIIVGLFLAAWATEEIGIHAIFGAFMVGVTLPRSTAMRTEITEKLEDVTVLFLLPIFFAVVGLSTRFTLLDRPVLWAVAALITAVAIVGKWGGSMIASRASGEGWRHANALGLLMNTRGLTEIVILTIGRSLGVISPALFTMMVLMALVTTFMATPLLAVFYPKRLIEREAARSAAAIDRSEPRKRASSRVLVAVGDPAHAGQLLALLPRLRFAGGPRPEVVLTHVAPLPGREEIRANLGALDDLAQAARATLGPLAGKLLGAGLDTRVRASVDDDVGRELARLTELEGADLLLVGWHHQRPYAGRNQLGAVVADVFAHASCDVAVLLDPDGRRIDWDRPVAVWHGSGLHDVAAIELAAALSGGEGCPLRVVAPERQSLPLPSIDVEVECVTVPSRQPAALLEVLADAGLIVIGCGADSDVTTFGPQRDVVIAGAAVPVLVVQRGLRRRGAAAGTSLHDGAEPTDREKLMSPPRTNSKPTVHR